MSEQPVLPEGQDDLHRNALLEMFTELSFREKVRKVMYGLRQPHDTGDYKWAKLQILRLWAPASAIVVPILGVLLLMVMATITQDDKSAVEVQVLQPEETPELEKIEPEQIEPPEEVDFQQDVEVSVDTPSPSPPVDFSPQPAQVDAVAQIKSPIIMKGMYGNRNPGVRGSALAKFGGGNATEWAVLRALRWLKKNQEADGSWQKSKPAMASLALLAYLAHGETPASEEFGATVEKALRFMVENQEASGQMKGKDGNNYTQPIAAYALSEAYGLTKVPMLREAAQKAVRPVLKGQFPTGGWGYKMEITDRADVSVMGWCAQALKAAKMAGVFDTEEDDELTKAMRKAIDGFKRNYYDDQTSGYGGFAYTVQGGKHNKGAKGLAGIGVLCMQLLGAGKEKECRNGVNLLSQATFDWAEPWGGQSPVYYWYYVTQAKFHEGQDTWKTWNATFSPTLVKQQQVEKNAIADAKGRMVDIGWWDSPSKDEHNGGNKTVMDTILCTLMLEVYYRYLPTFQTPEAVEIAPVQQQNNIAVEIDI